jgi:putative SOS response-associated peptidase YedK
MCGRTVLATSPDDLRAVFGLDEVPEVPPRYNVTPSQPVGVVRVLRGSTSRTLEWLRWGLVPAWADDPKVGHKLSLARAESVATAPAFRDAFRGRRCLVVVDGFYEWKREGGAGAMPRRGARSPSQPFVVRRPDSSPFALAGVWDRWTSRDGEVVESCAILTRPARPPLDEVHGRMPVVLPPEAWDAWLDPRADPVACLDADGGALVARAVSSYVNDPRHDDPRCLEPASPDEPAQRSLF